MPVQCVNEWGVYQAWLLALIPDYLCLSNPATGKKKIGKRKGIICQLRGVRQGHANNKHLFDHKYQNFQWTLPAAWELISSISILKILYKIYHNSRI